jgi:prepilin-type N-terminal cleavage/methylation domain-containing protein
MNKTSEGTDGFTLVELLVTLSLLSIMAIYAFNAFGLTGKMKTIAHSVETETEVQTVLRYFHEDMSALTPVYRQDPTGSAKLIFEGRETSLTYVGVSDGTKEVGGLYQVTWQLNKKRQLTIARHLLGTNSTENKDLVVLENVEAMTFTYNEDKANWLNQPQLPSLIVLNLALLNEQSVAAVTSKIVSGQ